MKHRYLRCTEWQPYVEELTNRQIRNVGRVILGALDVAAIAIGYEINRSQYSPPERSLLQLIFGGEQERAENNRFLPFNVDVRSFDLRKKSLVGEALSAHEQKQCLWTQSWLCLRWNSSKSGKRGAS